MAVRVSDNLKPQNDSTEFPVAYGEDIWLDKNKGSGTPNYDSIQNMLNNDELGGSGSSIQVDTMPIASAENENMIVEFVGESGTYQNGYFYQNIGSGDPKVYSWVQKNVQPSNATATDVSYDNTTSELIATNVQDAIDEIKGGLGTASGKNFTDLVRPNSHELVESGSVYSAINNALSSIYTPRGELTCAELTSSLLIEDNVGNIYTMSDSGTTSALFINGAGQTINVNDNVGIIKAGPNTYLFNLMGDAFDLHDYQKKELSTTIASATTVEGALNALNNGKVTKYNYTMAGTASLEDDIKTFVTALIALGANTYVGFFNRSGSLGTAGNYTITIYAEEGTSTFASGYIALGAGALGKTQYIVSYYKPTGSSEEWTIKKLAMENDIVTRHNYSVQGTTDAIADTKVLVQHIATLTVGVYSGEFKRSGVTFGSYVLTYFNDGGYSDSVTGTVTYGIGNDCTTYQVSYLKETSSTITWQIDKLATTDDIYPTVYIGGTQYTALIFECSIDSSWLNDSTFLIRSRGAERYLLSLGNTFDRGDTQNYSLIELSESYGKVGAVDYDYASNKLYITINPWGDFSITQLSGAKVNYSWTVVNSIPSTAVSIPKTKLVTESDVPHKVYDDYSMEGVQKTFAMESGAHYECKVFYYGGMCGIYDMVMNQFGANGGYIATVWEGVFKNYSISVEQSTGIVSMAGTGSDNVQFIICKLP